MEPVVEVRLRKAVGADKPPKPEDFPPHIETHESGAQIATPGQEFREADRLWQLRQDLLKLKELGF